MRSPTKFGIYAGIVLFGYTFLFDAHAVTYEDYQAAVADNNKVTIKGLSHGDGEDLDARLYKPAGEGPFPALIALHGAGGIFPYQLWWAKEISNNGFVVLFIDHYCTREYLCVHHTDDSDPRRGEIMRSWQSVSPRQRVMDAAAGYRFLTSKAYVKKEQIGLIGWSWGGSSALYVHKISERLNLPNGGFKGTIAFYPNLQYVMPRREWKHTGLVTQPTIIFYGKDDTLESEESYQELMKEEHPGPITVVGYDGAVRKFDELGNLRTKHHPSVGEFDKAFHRTSFEDSVKRINEFLAKNFQK